MGLPRPIATAIAAICCCAFAGRAPPARSSPPRGDFQKVTLDDNTSNPMELDVAPDGRVFYIERDGRLMIWKPSTRQTVTAGTVPVTNSQENGLLGLQLAPDFATSNWVYLFYSQLPDSSNTQVISRFKVNGNTLDLASEQRILTFQHQRGQCCHSSGSLLLRPRRQPLHLHGRQHEPVRLVRLQPDRRARRPRALGRAAHLGQHERPQRQDPAHQAGREPDGHARPGQHLHGPARQPVPGRATRPGRRSSAWASATRSASRSTRRRAGCSARDYGPDAEHGQRQPRPRGLGRVQRDDERRQLRLALLHPRQHAVQRLQLRDLDVRRQVRLRRPEERVAQQHGPDRPAAGASARPPGWGSARPTRASPASARAAPRWAARATTTTRTWSPTASSRRSTTTSGSSPSGTTAGSRPPTSTRAAPMTAHADRSRSARATSVRWTSTSVPTARCT